MPISSQLNTLVLAAIERRDLVRLALVASGQMLAAAISTLVIAKLFDILVGGPKSDARSLGLLVVLVVLAGVAFFLRRAERTLAERCGQTLSHRLRLNLWDHLHHLPTTAVSGERHGAVILRFVGDLNALKAWVSRGLVAGIVAAATVVGALIALLALDWRIAGVAAVGLLATFSLQASLGSRLRQRQRALRKIRTKLAADVMERVAGLAVVQVFGQSKRERRRLARASAEVRSTAVSYADISGTHQGIGDAASLLTLAAVLTIAWLLRGSTAPPSAGVLAACLVLTRMLSRPVRTLARVHEVWHRASVASEKIEQFLALPPELRDASTARALKPGDGKVKFRNVSVQGALYGISAVAPAGAVVRVEGHNGAGKSTLLQVLATLRRADRGKVVVDGRDLAVCRLATLRRDLGVVSPELPLLRGTVRRNLTYRLPGASPDAIAEVIDRLELATLLEKLPAGLQSRVLAGGVNLSAGERQRLELARAVIGNPRILILDEPDAHLDAAGLATLRRLIDEFSGTIFLVWHGDDAPQADRVWTLQDGHLARRQHLGQGARAAASGASNVVSMR